MARVLPSGEKVMRLNGFIETQRGSPIGFSIAPSHSRTVSPPCCPFIASPSAVASIFPSDEMAMHLMSVPGDSPGSEPITQCLVMFHDVSDLLLPTASVFLFGENNTQETAF